MKQLETRENDLATSDVTSALPIGTPQMYIVISVDRALVTWTIQY